MTETQSGFDGDVKSVGQCSLASFFLSVRRVKGLDQERKCGHMAAILYSYNRVRPSVGTARDASHNCMSQISQLLPNRMILILFLQLGYHELDHVSNCWFCRITAFCLTTYFALGFFLQKNLKFLSKISPLLHVEMINCLGQS